MPTKYQGFVDEPNIQQSEASGGKKYRQTESDWTGRIEGNIAGSEADKPHKKSAPKPDTVRSR